MTPGDMLLIAILIIGGLIGWSLKRAHGSWGDYKDGRAKVPRLRTRFYGNLGAAVRWGALAVALAYVMLHL